MRFERHSTATGPPRTQVTSMLSTTYTERMAVLEYPAIVASRIRGRHTTSRPPRTVQPNFKRFKVRRNRRARASLWVTEFILTYDGPAVL